jgi:hypothetical protein
LSLDGSDGGHGGRLAASYIVSGARRPRTAANKTSVSSTLVCGSSAAGEPLPLHIMFSSSAQNEENYSVSAEWMFDLPCVFVQFGHETSQSFPCSVTVNPKGGTDARVLAQLLSSYIERLYPDARDQAGYHVLLKIDGGPGRLDLNSLAELRSRGVYLFPGVQHTTHVTQETDQNYGLFKSMLRKYIQVLMNELCAQARPNDGITASTAPVALSRKSYGLLLSGRVADPEKGLQAIPPIFATAFSYERNLRSWEKVGAVPFTMNCLNNEAFRVEVNDERDELLNLEKKHEEAYKLLQR